MINPFGGPRTPDSNRSGTPFLTRRELEQDLEEVLSFWNAQDRAAIERLLSSPEFRASCRRFIEKYARGEDAALVAAANFSRLENRDRILSQMRRAFTEFNPGFEQNFESFVAVSSGAAEHLASGPGEIHGEPISPEDPSELMHLTCPPRGLADFGSASFQAALRGALKNVLGSRMIGADAAIFQGKDVGEIPPLSPALFNTLLNSGIFGTLAEDMRLILVPKCINEVPVSIEYLRSFGRDNFHGVILWNPRDGNPWGSDREESAPYMKEPPDASRWLLVLPRAIDSLLSMGSPKGPDVVTPGDPRLHDSVIPSDEDDVFGGYERAQLSIERQFPGWRVPKAREAVAAALFTRLETGEGIFTEGPIVCDDVHEEDIGHPERRIVVGPDSQRSLAVTGLFWSESFVTTWRSGGRALVGVSLVWSDDKAL